jgi:hypothetical protein
MATINENTAATIAITAANTALQAAQTAQTAASQADIAARRGSNVTNITVINPSAAGVPGAVQFSSNINQLSSSRNFVFDTNSSNLQINGNLNVLNLLNSSEVLAKSISASGTVTAESLIAARVESLANIQVANRVEANVVYANAFYGNGSQLTGLLSPNNPTLTGNVSVPLITLDASINAPVPLGLLNDILPTKANINSPNFTGTPTAPTITNVATSDNSIATTAFVQSVMNTKANTSNVTFTNVSLVGNVTATTQVSSDRSNLLATTQFVQNQKISPIFTGIPLAPTPNGTFSGQVATVGFVRSSSAPSVIMSRRSGGLGIGSNAWQLIIFDTFERNTIGATINFSGPLGYTFNLPAGTYVYNLSLPVTGVDPEVIIPITVFTRFQNMDTNFTLQNISAVEVSVSTTTINGTGQIVLSGTTRIGLQAIANDPQGVAVNGYDGFQTGIIQFWKVA